MGTRADFYVGTGAAAEWLGSIAFDGYRIHEMEAVNRDDSDDSRACWDIKTARNEADYRDAVARLLAVNTDATTPDRGWPWPWNNSCTTDRAYRFEGTETVPYAWGAPLPEDPEDDSDLPKAEWPDMADRKAVTLGHRSGAIFISAA